MICIFVGALIENVKVLHDHNETSVLFTFEHNEYMLKVCSSRFLYSPYEL